MVSEPICPDGPNACDPRPQIAVYLNTQGQVSHPPACGTVVLYVRDGGTWTPTTRIPTGFVPDMTMAEQGVAARHLHQHLHACQALIVERTNGLGCVILARLGMNLWRSAGSIDQQLENVALRMTEAAPEAVPPPPPALALIPTPEPVGEADAGRYRIDISDAHERGFSPQQAVVPFLRQRAFRHLEIRCRRQPCWLTTILAELGLTVAVEPKKSDDPNLYLSVSLPPPGCRPLRRIL